MIHSEDIQTEERALRAESSLALAWTMCVYDVEKMTAVCAVGSGPLCMCETHKRQCAGVCVLYLHAASLLCAGLFLQLTSNEAKWLQLKAHTDGT